MSRIRRARRRTTCRHSRTSSRRATRPDEIVEIARKLRKQAGLPDEPTGEVSEESQSLTAGLLARAKA